MKKLDSSHLSVKDLERLILQIKAYNETFRHRLGLITFYKGDFAQWLADGEEPLISELSVQLENRKKGTK